MRTIRKLLESDTRGTEGYEIVDDKTIIINNSKPYPAWTEAQQFIGVIEKNWCRLDIIDSIGDVFAEKCKITFKVGLDEEIEEFKAF